jgi:hypothetical protein
MTDSEFLALCLLALYLYDCVNWIPRNSVAFLTYAWRGWRLIRGHEVFGNRRGGIAFVNPFPPLGRLFLSSPFPVCFSPSMVSTATNLVAGLTPPEDTYHELAYTEIEDCEVRESSLFINRTLFVECTHATTAHALAEFLLQLRAAPEEERGERIRAWLNNTLRDRRLTVRLGRFDRAALFLWALCNLQFALLIILVAKIFSGYDSWSSVLPMVFLLLLQSVLISIKFWRLHAHFFPAERATRIRTLLAMLPFPPASIRAYDAANRDLLANFHPLLIARRFLTHEQFLNFAGRFYRDLAFPISASGLTTEAREAESWFCHEHVAALDRFFNSLGILEDTLLTPAVPSASGVIAYCPRCLEHFTVVDQTCPDCGAFELRAFSRNAPHPQEEAGP